MSGQPDHAGRGPDERAPAVLPPGDSGEVECRPDGSVSVPVFEEEIVCVKRPVLRERIVIRKDRVTEERVVEADLRRERVAVEVDPAVADRVSSGGRPFGPPPGGAGD
ncbi:MAG TPA: DUF2382 domain-containing protein [Acidimicrobiia bacterium]|nr:DUF2382 domain-containing protein [Acidimicrobiia bacterium]